MSWMAFLPGVELDIAGLATTTSTRQPSPNKRQSRATHLVNIDLPSRTPRKDLSISCDAVEEQIEGVRAGDMAHLVPCADPSAFVGARDGSAIHVILKNSAGPGQAMGVAGNLEFTVVQAFGD
jgi:hypothetical protein